jgi:hypothetical protein
MDPFIEACGLWEDFHTKLIGEIERNLAAALPERYMVRTGERSYIVLEGREEEVEYRESFVEIYDSMPQQPLVTCIEVLSPSNKRPNTPGWELYQRKRQSVLLSDVNLVEVDLLRGGQRMPLLDPWPDSPYALLIARSKKRGRCRVWPAISLRPLPVVSLPLAPPDGHIPLDLQPMIRAIYQRSRYERSIDYHRPPTPPLTTEETMWLNQRLNEVASS